MMLARSLCAALFLALVPFVPLRAASVPLLAGPSDPSQTQSTINGVIQQINAIITPLLPTVAGSVNTVALTPAVSGGVATISIQPGGDPNAPIGLSSAGNGNIVLFAGNTASTGVLQFANTASFIPATGLAVCPGYNPPVPLGISNILTGYYVTQDWLGRKHGLPAC